MPHSNIRSVKKPQLARLLTAFLAVCALAGVLLSGLLVPTLGLAGMVVKSGPEVFDSLPADLKIVPPSEQSTLVASDGTVLASFYTENRIVVPLDKISKHLQQAVISTEDRRFYDHKGIDPEGMARAALNNLGGSGSTQGASTLTQQYVKNSLLEAGLQKGDQDMIDEATEQTIGRKLREARYALDLEKRLSKEEILAGYLNIAPFGPNVYGAEAAAHLYFSKPAAKLDALESALLAGIVKSPNEYNPLRNPDAAQDRRDTVLTSMLAQNKITQEEYDKFVKIPVKKMLKPDYTPQGCAGAGNAAYFCEYVRSELLRSKEFGESQEDRLQKLQRGGLTIKTTLNKDLQAKAFKAVQDRIPINDPSGANTAIVSMDPRNGAIVAMAQNTNFGTPTEQNPGATQNSITADKAHGGGDGFQAGSALKPFTMLEWFREGRSAYERVGGHSIHFSRGEWNIPCAPEMADNWTVQDVDGKPGSFNIIEATEKSVNRAYAHMATQLDMCKIFDGMKDLGISKPDGSRLDPHPSSIIGAPATPLSMARAYSAFANKGKLCKPMSVTEVTDRDGKQVAKFKSSCSQAIPEKNANQVADVLQQTTQSAFYRASDIGRPHIGKTGTTDNNAGLWFVGGTPQLITGAWAGYASQSSASMNGITVNGTYYGTVYGGTFTAPMWKQYMESALEGQEVMNFPEADLTNGKKDEPARAREPQHQQAEDEGERDAEPQYEYVYEYEEDDGE
ncbi:transglycosylase domain-containing protein [Gleimia hominis]|uniref:transglycosylase domain-containing protein n=1 Tax=Gleimia hominis TaxID=595468 RepID=UPI000C806892|nr:transglycosylase domain-containing protein [Gleimia hominis]WIK64042.1 transglycosylase domain-containing protein [Gleimia hominis]